MARNWKDVRADRGFTAEAEERITEIREQMAAEEHAFYADPANREPEGPPVRRRRLGDVTDDEADDAEPS